MSDRADTRRNLMARHRRERAEAIAAILALPAEAQRAIARRLALDVLGCKQDEADDINREGIKAQLDYLCEIDAAEWLGAAQEMLAEFKGEGEVTT